MSTPLSKPSSPESALALTSNRWRRYRRLLLSALGLALFLTAGLYGWRTLRYRQDCDHALELARIGEFAKAEPLLKELAGRSPRDVRVIEALARGYLEAKQAADADAYLTRWVDLRPQDVQPYLLRLKLERDQNQFDKGLADARQILTLEPGNATARKQLPGLEFSAGHFVEAEQACRHFLDQEPQDRGMTVLLADALRAQGKATEAASLLDQLLKLDPNLPSALMLRGILYYEADQSDKAIPLFRKVLAVDPSRKRSARYQLSLALDRAGQSEEAQRVMAEVRNMQDAEVLGIASGAQPDNLDLQVRAARAQLANGNTQAGLQQLATVLAKDPHFSPAHQALAEYYDKQGQVDLAAEHRRLAASTP